MFRWLAVAALLLVALPARAEDWRIISWWNTALIAFEPSSLHETSARTKVFDLLQVTQYPGQPLTEGRRRTVEIDCDGQRLRDRGGQYVAGPIRTEKGRLFEAWRDQDSELDKLLLQAFCEPVNWPSASLVRNTSARDAVRIHQAVSLHPDTWSSDPTLSAWSAAVAQYRADGLTTPIPHLLTATITSQDFTIAGSGPGYLLLTPVVEVFENAPGHARTPVLSLGHGGNPEVASWWLLPDFECAARQVREMSWAGYDRQGQMLFGYDVGLLDAIAKDIPPNSKYAWLFPMACDPSHPLRRMPFARGNQAQALDAYERFYSPNLMTVLFYPRTPWAALFRAYCGPLGCELHPSVEAALHIAGHVAVSAVLAGLLFVLRRTRRSRMEWRPPIGYPVGVILLSGLSAGAAVAMFAGAVGFDPVLLAISVASGALAVAGIPYGFVVRLKAEAGAGFTYRDPFGRRRQIRWGEVQALKWDGHLVVVTQDALLRCVVSLEGLNDFVDLAASHSAPIDETLRFAVRTPPPTHRRRASLPLPPQGNRRQFGLRQGAQPWPD